MRVPVPAVEHPAGGYDLIAVFVRAHQADAVLESLGGLEADVLFALNWAAGPEPLGAVIGRERVLLSFPTAAGTMDGDVVRYRPASWQFVIFPAVPVYCRCTPAEAEPPFSNPVSSPIRTPSGSPSAAAT